MTASSKYKRFKTGTLFSKPSFLSGAGTALNLAGNYHPINYSGSSNESDRKAIENDFNMVGQDILDALKKIKG